MIKFVFSLIFGVVILCGNTGCSVFSIPTSQTAPTFGATLAKSQAEVRQASSIAFSVYIGTMKDPTEQQKVIKFAHDTAKQISDGITANQLNFASVRVYAQSLIAQSNLKDKVAVGLIFNALADVVDIQLTQSFSDVTKDTNVMVGTTLVKAAADGILDATGSIQTMVKPTTQP